MTKTLYTLDIKVKHMYHPINKILDFQNVSTNFARNPTQPNQQSIYFYSDEVFIFPPEEILWCEMHRDLGLDMIQEETQYQGLKDRTGKQKAVRYTPI